MISRENRTVKDACPSASRRMASILDSVPPRVSCCYRRSSKEKSSFENFRRYFYVFLNVGFQWQYFISHYVGNGCNFKQYFSLKKTKIYLYFEKKATFVRNILHRRLVPLDKIVCDLCFIN